MKQSQACIGLGSNLGRSRSLLHDAWHSLGSHPEITLMALSPLYRTKPVAMDSPHWFINAVGMLRTTLAPMALLDVLMATEQQFGRVRFPEHDGCQDRTLDLDLLLFDEQIMRTERLVLPHPALHQRMFTLRPLADIAPQLRHPLLKKTIAELLAALVPRAAQGDVEHVTWQEE